MADARRPRKKNSIAGQFAARPIAMLECAAYRVLSRAAHMVLSRLEVEHAHHGGKDNGKLPCTFAHFEEYGVHRRSVAPAIRELVALGFVEVTRKGAAGNAEFRQPNLYRLTYRPAHNATGDGTHEYRKLGSLAEAEAAAEKRGLAQTRKPWRPAKNEIPVAVFAKFRWQKVPPKITRPRWQKVPLRGQCRKCHHLYIYGQGPPLRTGEALRATPAKQRPDCRAGLQANTSARPSRACFRQMLIRWANAHPVGKCSHNKVGAPPLCSP